MNDGQRGAWRAAMVACINLTVGVLHFVTGRAYRGPYRHLVNGYLIDVALPFAAYFLLVQMANTLRFLRPWYVKSGIVFAVITSAEIAQHFGVAVFGSTFDTWDIVAYGAGALLAAVADRFVFPRMFWFWSTATSRVTEQTG